MKRNLLIACLCILVAVLAVSCKDEPEVEPSKIHVSNLADIETVDGKTASFGYGSSSTEAVVIDGKGQYIVDEWQDLWFIHDVTVKGVEFAKGVSFFAQGDEERTITIEDCIVRYCSQKDDLLPKVDENNNFRIDNSGNGLCLGFDGQKEGTVNVVVNNCTFIGDNDATQPKRDSYATTSDYLNGNNENFKGRGNGVSLGVSTGKGHFVKSANISGCSFSGLRNAAVQLYTFDCAIEIENCTFESWGVNCDEDLEKPYSYAIRGDVENGSAASLAIKGCTFDSKKDSFRYKVDNLTPTVE